MRIVIGQPPLPNTEHLGRPQSMQNRQFQFFNEGTNIYPVIPAYAATMLKEAGHQVFWMDGPAEDMLWEEYICRLYDLKVDLIVWEVKTPTVKRVWELTYLVKRCALPNVKVVLMGDHVTAMPEETLENSDADYVIIGGDYDFSLCKLVAQLEEQPDTKKSKEYSKPIRATKGSRFEIGTESSLDSLPVLNRRLTKWENYAYRNGNYKYLPATYTMFGRDCWWRHQGGCTFCSWTNTFKNFRVVSVSAAMAEVENCASLGIREIFDDTGTFPIGEWLHSFCKEMIKFNKGKRHGKARITMGCNMRPGALSKEDWKILGAAGFRFILFGLESANYNTLQKINKGQSPGDMEQSAKWASEAGLDPHATCMIGYSHETKQEANHTIEFTKRLFIKGYIKTLQATIIIPYPGTQLFKECEEKKTP